MMITVVVVAIAKTLHLILHGPLFTFRNEQYEVSQGRQCIHDASGIKLIHRRQWSLNHQATCLLVGHKAYKNTLKMMINLNKMIKCWSNQIGSLQEMEIKKMAKEGNNEGCKILAKQLVATRKQKNRIYSANSKVKQTTIK